MSSVQQPNWGNFPPPPDSIGQNSHSHPLLLFMLVDEILLFLSVEFSQDVVLIILLQLAVGTISIEDRSKFDRIHFSN